MERLSIVFASMWKQCTNPVAAMHIVKTAVFVDQQNISITVKRAWIGFYASFMSNPIILTKHITSDMVMRTSMIISAKSTDSETDLITIIIESFFSSLLV